MRAQLSTLSRVFLLASSLALGLGAHFSHADQRVVVCNNDAAGSGWSFDGKRRPICNGLPVTMTIQQLQSGSGGSSGGSGSSVGPTPEQLVEAWAQGFGVTLPVLLSIWGGRRVLSAITQRF